MNADNPYQPPSSKTQRSSVPSAAHVIPPLGIAAVLALAATAGLSTTFLMAFPDSLKEYDALSWMTVAAFWITPIGALLAAAALGLRTFNLVDFLFAIFQSFQAAFVVALTLVGGYFAFAATCCCTNVFTGFISLYDNANTATCVGAGFVTSAATLVGCAAVFAVHSAIRRKRQEQT